MITVRFPNGQAVQYNSANYVEAKDGFYRIAIATENNNRMVAYVPKDCIVEFDTPCRVYNALTKDNESATLREIRLLRRQLREQAKRKKK